MLLADRYRVRRRLGAGGMAVVYQAQDERLCRDVAVKRLHAESPENDAKRLRREARIGASLKHVGLVTVYDVMAWEDSVLVVMEYVDGETLAEALSEEPLEDVRALRVLRAVAEALDHVHARGVLHRDVKPANILLGRDGSVKLADLGIATATESTRITRTGVVVGTPAYMAPEVLRGKPATAAADVYALAAVAFEALSGRKARAGTSPVAIASGAERTPPPDLRAIRPGTPPAAARVLMRGLSSAPADRPRTAGALVEELAAALAQRREETTEAMAPAAPPAPASPPPARSSPAPPTRAPTAAAPHRRATPPVEPRADERSSRRGLAAFAALLLVAGAVLAVVLLAVGGGNGNGSSKSTATTGAARSTETRDTGTDRTTPRARSVAPAAASVRDFYESAAKGDTDTAWALTTPNTRAQFGDRAAFDRTFSTLESITFSRLEVTDQGSDTATVAFDTVARHTNRTDRCQSTAAMVRSGDRWLVDRFNANCSAV